MKKLDTKVIQQMPKPVRVVSFAFAIEGREPVRTKNGLYLYEYK